MKIFNVLPKVSPSILSLSFLAFLLIGGVAVTQEQIPTTLFLLVRTGASLSREDLQKTLQGAYQCKTNPTGCVS